MLADWAWSERNSKRDFRNSSSVAAARAHEAERLLREYLAIRLRGTGASHWRTDDLRSRLGGALLAVAATDPALTSEARLAKVTEAEALLLEGNEALHQNMTVETRYKRDSLTRLVRLYEARDKPDKTAEWQQKLDDFNKAEAKLEAEEMDDSPGH